VPKVEKAEAAVRLAKTDIWVPDVEAFARYSYQNNVPFLARNFGTLGIHLGYDLFDGGRKRSVKREREAQLAQAKENLARLTDEVELAIHTADNKLERTQTDGEGVGRGCDSAAASRTAYCSKNCCKGPR